MVQASVQNITVIEVPVQVWLCIQLIKFIGCVFVDRKLMAINIRVQEVRAGTEFHTHRKLRHPNKAEVNHTKGAQGS